MEYDDLPYFVTVDEALGALLWVLDTLRDRTTVLPPASARGERARTKINKHTILVILFNVFILIFLNLLNNTKFLKYIG